MLNPTRVKASSAHTTEAGSVHPAEASSAHNQVKRTLVAADVEIESLMFSLTLK